MARAKKSEEERSMDSLMDAMTNVVGILLLILIVSSLGISAAVRKIVANIEPVTEQELQILKTTRENTLENLEKLRQLHTEMDEKKLEEEEATQLVLELEEFEENNQDLIDKTSDIEEWRKKVEEEEAKREVNEEEIRVASAELADLRAILDQTPKREVKAAKVVKMPNPRFAPDQAVAYYVVCKNNKIYFVGDPYEHVFRIRDVIDENFTKLAFTGAGVGSFTHTIQGTRQNEARTGFLPLAEDVRRTSRTDKEFENWEAVKLTGYRRTGSEPNFNYEKLDPKGVLSSLFGNQDRKEFNIQKFRLDLAKVKAFFGDGATGPPDFHYFIDRNGNTDRLKLSLGFKEEGGLSPEEARAGTSVFQQACKKASVNRGALFYYYVSPESFDAYLQAREISEAYSIPAGWTTWKGEKLDLRVMALRETVKFWGSGLPIEDYRKIADTSGPNLAKVLKEEIDNLEKNVAGAVPEDMKGQSEKEKFITQLTAERKDWIYRNLQPWSRAIYSAVLAASEATSGQKDIRVDVHPPEIPHTRIFVGAKPPSKPKPPADPNKPKPKPKPPTGGGAKIILD